MGRTPRNPREHRAGSPTAPRRQRPECARSHPVLSGWALAAAGSVTAREFDGQSRAKPLYVEDGGDVCHTPPLSR